MITATLEHLIGFALVDTSLHKQVIRDMRIALDDGSEYELPAPTFRLGYIRAKIDDITHYQFSQRHRTLVELVTNSIDAQATRIDVRTRRDMTVIADNGTGMDFETLITELALPFQSSKDGKNTIGRFGLGFFSSLGELRSGGSVIVSTRKGAQGYSAKYWSEAGHTMVGYAREDDLPEGTSVRVTHPPGLSWHQRFRTPQMGIVERFKELRKSDSHERARTIAHHLKFVNPAECEIRINEKLVNSGIPEEGKYPMQYTIPFEGSTIAVYLGLGKNDGVFRRLSGSIQVSAAQGALRGAVNYPLSLGLSESRDAFKDDERFERAQSAVFEHAMLPYLNELKRSGLPYNKKAARIAALTMQETRAFAGTASIEGLIEFMELISPTSRRPDGYLILEDENSHGLADFFSNTRVVNKLDDAALGGSLAKNQNVRTISSIILASEPQYVAQLSKNDRQHYFGRARLPSIVTFRFVDGPTDGLSPIACVDIQGSAERVEPAARFEIIVNKNHRYYTRETRTHATDMAITYAAMSACMGVSKTEQSLIFGDRP